MGAGKIRSIVLLSLLGSTGAHACSCPLQSVPQAFQDATAVFVGKLASVKQRPPVSKEWTSTRVIGKHEIAELDVLESWKGNWRPGDTVKFEADVFNASGPCAVSLINNPAWVMEGATDKPAKFSGFWLIYAFGSEPFELSLCARSMPLDTGGFRDLADLYRLAEPLTPRWLLPENKKGAKGQ